MQVGDIVEFCPEKTRRLYASVKAHKKSGVIVGIVHHEILNASVYEVMWNDGHIHRQYSSDIRAIPHVL